MECHCSECATACRAVAEPRALLGLIPLGTFLERLRSRWLCRVLQAGALFTAFQPMVSLGERRIVAHDSLLHACLDDEEIGAERLLDAARGMGMQNVLKATARRLSVLREGGEAAHQLRS